MVSIQSGNAVNVVTEFRYGPGGRLEALIARNPETGDQVTRFEYGVTLADSDIATNDLLRAEVYPDSANSSDRVTYSYNRQGQRTKMTDQNGSVHEYDYDALGRQTADKVTTLASGVDGAVRRIGQSYEVRGMVEMITSAADVSGATVVNQVQNVYNSFGQLTAQYQEHSGSVNTGTTPKVLYAYADGNANTIRPTSMTYPNGRVLEYRYDDTAADKLSRIRTLRFDSTDVCQYTYLGLGTFITTDYVEPQVKLNYSLGSGANPYTGFDRFGRIIDLLWAKYGIGASDLVHLKHGYDQASNRTHREDLVAQSFNKDFDELYEYDGMQRLKKFHRGRLTTNKKTITSPKLQQGWQLDSTGNWQNFTQNDQVDASQTLDQQRNANRVNEITQIARTVGPNWATPSYDRNGNMTVIPQPKDMTQTFQGTWDAWNRLVRLTEPNGSGGWQTLQENAYDGQTWRTVVKSYTTGTLSETRNAYFTSNWQNIEERLGTSPQTALANRQFLWGLRYIDDIIVRDRDTDGIGSLDERLYAMQDANWNVVALYNPSTSNIVERFAYTAYGIALYLDVAFGLHFTAQSQIEYLFAGYNLNLSGLYSIRNRFLAADIGQFICRDISTKAVRGQFYDYCRSNPENLVDENGREPSPPVAGASPAGCRPVCCEWGRQAPAKAGVGSYFSWDCIRKKVGNKTYFFDLLKSRTVNCPATVPSKVCCDLAASLKEQELVTYTLISASEDACEPTLFPDDFPRRGQLIEWPIISLCRKASGTPHNEHQSIVPGVPLFPQPRPRLPLIGQHSCVTPGSSVFFCMIFGSSGLGSDPWDESAFTNCYDSQVKFMNADCRANNFARFSKSCSGLSSCYARYGHSGPP